MAAELEFQTVEDLNVWLSDKPVKWAQVIAARSALRVFPLVFKPIGTAQSHNDQATRYRLVLQTFRATFISWAARNHPAYDMIAAATAAAAATDAATTTTTADAVAAATDVAATATYAAAAAAATDAAAAAAAAAAATGAANAAVFPMRTVWHAVAEDCRWLAENDGNLIDAQLWLQEVRGDKKYAANIPIWVRNPLDTFAPRSSESATSWQLIANWYRAIIGNTRGTEPRSLWGEGVDIEIALQPEDFWKITELRAADQIMDEVAEIVAGKFSDGGKADATLREFIVSTLDEAKRPLRLNEIYERVHSAGYPTVRDSVRGRVNELTYGGVIQRVDRGLYASNNWQGSSYDRPAMPEPGPGPQYGNKNGKLTAFSSSPANDEIAAQERLIARMRRDLDALGQLARPIGNTHPHLARAIAEYRDLLSTNISELDVTGLWSVGNSLAGYAQAFRDQNVSRTLSEPLEPQLDGLLHGVVRQHGALILGFEEGRDLVKRADEFALDRNRLVEIEGPGNELLHELTQNAALVDEATRALHAPIRDYLHDLGWTSSRTAYSGYLIIRNGVRALIHLTIGQHPTIGAIVGILAGGSALAGDPNMEFLRAALPFLRENATQLCAFFNHSLEMRAYVEWALKMIDEIDEAKEVKPII